MKIPLFLYFCIEICELIYFSRVILCDYVLGILYVFMCLCVFL
jgi:hypothetical protein